MMASTATTPASLFHALGDPTRRAIVERVSQRPMSVSGLAEPLGITLTAVTQHLRILEGCRLVHTEKTGRVRTCRLDTAGLDAIQQWVSECRSTWERRLDRLGEILED